MDTLTQSRPADAKTASATPQTAAPIAPTRAGLTPVKRAPSMVTINGMGTKLYGKRDPNPSDGTFVATLYFVFLFVPLVPLSSYLVAANGVGFSFFGKVPLTGGQKLWRRAALALITATVLAVGARAAIGATHSDVQLVNGLDVPVSLSIDGNATELEPRSRATVASVEKGQHAIVVRDAKQRVIEQQIVAVPGGVDVVAYNVLGAAPLYAEGIRYTRSTSVRPAGAPIPENPVEFFGGTSFVTREDVPYLFQSPPSQIEMSGSSASTMRYSLQLGDGGWRATVSMLEGRNQAKQAAALARAVWFADPECGEALQMVLLRESRGDDSAALRHCEQLVHELPESTTGHRTLQSLLLLAGRGEECRDRYRRMAAESPESAQLAYLRARVEPRATSITLLAALATKDPNDPFVRRTLGFELLQASRFDEAVAQLEALAKLDARTHAEMVGEHARALVGAGRVKDALALFARHAATIKDAMPFANAVIYGRVVELAAPMKGADPAEIYVRQQSGPDAADEAAAWFRVLVRAGDVDDATFAKMRQPSTRVAAEIMRAALTDLDDAARKAAAADADVLAAVDPPTLLLLAGEHARRGDASTAARLASAIHRTNLGAKELADLVVTGSGDAAIDELDLEMQAVMHLSQARRARDAGDEARAVALEQRARKDDVLRGVVTRVLGKSPR